MTTGGTGDSSWLEGLPQRRETRETELKAINAFRDAVAAGGLFEIHQEATDFGTDLQLAAVLRGSVTNFRAHVQVKGTGVEDNSDGSVSLSIATKTLAYLYSQPHSVLACYHHPSRRLLTTYAAEVVYDYTARGIDIQAQKTITVRFRELFDSAFQEKLHARVMATGRDQLDDRHSWLTTPPAELSAKAKSFVPLVDVPADPERAQRMLRELYAAGEDAVISRAFHRFAAALKSGPALALLPAYLAEINLGIRGGDPDEERVREAQHLLTNSEELLEPASFHYCMGNAHLALEELEEARDALMRAHVHADEPGLTDISAQAAKNLGSVMSQLGHDDAARACYERALDLSPDLPEAHWALGLWHGRVSRDFGTAIEHLDQVLDTSPPAGWLAAIAAWRSQFLFELGREQEAFSELNRLLGLGSDLKWSWPWAARLVATFGRSSVVAAKRALRFWDLYRREVGDQRSARHQVMLCLWWLNSQREPLKTDLSDFRELVLDLIETTDQPDERAFLWDRLGHWAQFDGEWNTAAECYQEAYALEPARYGYCLGTALNHIGEFSEALTILQPQAETHLPDAMSWFQVAFAEGGLGNWAAAIRAYREAIRLDEDYALAWFNLGRTLLRAGDVPGGARVLREAVGRFPDHPVAQELPDLDLD